MPEGDTLHRTAGALRRFLAGAEVTALRVAPGAGATLGSRRGGPLPVSVPPGTRVEAVEARGKHLLVGFSDGRTLRTHLGMHGSWHLYRSGEAWRRPGDRARVVIGTSGAVAVCFGAAEVALLEGGAARVGGRAAKLGPDLLAPDLDPARVVARWRSRSGLPVGVALLDQRLAAGIGNIYKSEVLFLCGVDPFTPVGDLDDAVLGRLAATARAQMARNLGSGPRRTRPPGTPGRFWVYGRSGRPCYRCGTPVRMRRQGEQGRSTYYCPGCQAVKTPEP